MTNSATGTRTADANGLNLMIADSRAAVKNFNMYGSQFNAVPKSKNLFYVEFNRPVAAGGADLTKGLGLFVKNVDRPKISFATETLNQYNRKRVVQTTHSFEDFVIKFHDTVDPTLMKLFTAYYEYYYGDHSIYSTGASNAIYDVVSAQQYQNGQWGFHPQANANNSYFFTDITVYQFYNGLYERFSLINPKLTSFNPDDFDFAVGAVTNEIVLTVAFEGIVYEKPGKITSDMAAKYGLDVGNYLDIQDTIPASLHPGLAESSNKNRGDFSTVLTNALTRNLSSVLKGNFNQFVGDVAGAYDVNRGIALGKGAVSSISNLVSGNASLSSVQSSITNLTNLSNSTFFNNPGSWF